MAFFIFFKGHLLKEQLHPKFRLRGGPVLVHSRAGVGTGPGRWLEGIFVNVGSDDGRVVFEWVVALFGTGTFGICEQSVSGQDLTLER